MVGGLYHENDDRRDAGFSIFYMGINLGAFFGPLLTGLAQDKIGFHAGFGLAAIGMAIGLIQYTLGRKNLRGIGATPPNPLPADQRIALDRDRCRRRRGRDRGRSRSPEFSRPTTSPTSSSGSRSSRPSGTSR